MKAFELKAYLDSMNGGWVDPSDTVDKFIAGNADTVVNGIAVGWISTLRTIKSALESGCNLLITHEPTWYGHTDADRDIFRFEFARAKRKFIEESGIVILRCHDLLDRLPEHGVADCWGKALELGAPAEEDGYFKLYLPENMTAGGLAAAAAAAAGLEGQEAVELVGDPGKKVNRVAIGTGAITPLSHWLEKWQIDGAVCSDDGFCYWRDGAIAMDAGISVVVVNHAVSEQQGLRALAELLRRRFESIPVRFIGQGCMFGLAGSAQAPSF